LIRAKSGTFSTLSSSSHQNITSISTGPVVSGGGVNRIGGGGDMRVNKQMRRCESAVGLTGTCPLENNASNLSSTPLKRQGNDYLCEIDGKILSIYGHGALKHTLTVRQFLKLTLFHIYYHYIISIVFNKKNFHRMYIYNHVLFSNSYIYLLITHASQTYIDKYTKKRKLHDSLGIPICMNFDKSSYWSSFMPN
jgi:hypothetical protein